MNNGKFFQSRSDHRFVATGLKLAAQFLKQFEEMIVERRHIEMLCDRKLTHLVPPFTEQYVTLLPD